MEVTPVLRRLLARNSIAAAILLAIAPGGARSQETVATIKGYVLDSACAFIKNLEKPVSTECALACAKAGSPLVILADDGTIYWPISRRDAGHRRERPPDEIRRQTDHREREDL